MKSFFNYLILCGLVVLVGCSGGSPKPPTVTPPPGGDVWLITSLEASNDNPLVNTTVLVTATVTQNGNPAPDETQVEFIHSGGAFVPSNGSSAATVLTTGGQASVSFGATDAGLYTVQARVKTVTSQVQVAYRLPDTSDALQIWAINPAFGPYGENQTVTLYGKGIRRPVEVFFSFPGVSGQYQAIIQDVEESSPLSSAGTITILTPAVSDPGESLSADLRVAVGVGTTDEQSQTYVSAYTYVSQSVIVGDLTIFGVEPYWGRSAGGETVTILGLNFAAEVNGEDVKHFDEVYFTYQGQELVAQVERWSESQIEVITPRFSLTPLEVEQKWGVKLTDLNGGDAVNNEIFIVKSDIAIPEISGISPTAGPLDGGTLVTITGHGFEIPMQVHFGDYEATDIQVIDDQSLADNDIITCRTPDLSQAGVTPPLAVTVRVTNLQTGNTASSAQTYTFGDILYVGQANPTEGQIGDLLTLFGAGFEDPLTVWFSANIEFDVIAVTGTEITLRSPPTLAPTCSDRSGSFRVVLNESNREASGGNYTLLGSNPTITSVDPIFVTETNFGNGVTPGEIDIYGVRFADDLLVRINNFTIAPEDVTVNSPEHIHIAEIPAPNDFGLVFNTGSCTTGTGLQGIRNEPTPVNVTVRNLPLGCEDTLSQGLVYVPEDQTCVAAPVLSVTLDTSFPETAAGSCSAPQPLVIANNGEGTLEVQTVLLQGRFFFDGAGSNQTAGPITVPPFTSDTSLDVYFCPDVPNGLLYTGVLVITSNDAASPYQNNNLSGQEATPPEIGTAPYGDGDTWTFPAIASGSCTATETLTITNTGISVLTVGAVTTNDTQFAIVGATPTTLQPGATGNVDVQFCPAAAGPQSGMLSIAHDATNEPNPIQINVAGTGL